MSVTTACPTVAVTRKVDGKIVVINESDFDSERYTKPGEAKQSEAPQEKPVVRRRQRRGSEG